MDDPHYVNIASLGLIDLESPPSGPAPVPDDSLLSEPSGQDSRESHPAPAEDRLSLPQHDNPPPLPALREDGRIPAPVANQDNRPLPSVPPPDDDGYMYPVQPGNCMDLPLTEHPGLTYEDLYDDILPTMPAESQADSHGYMVMDIKQTSEGATNTNTEYEDIAVYGPTMRKKATSNPRFVVTMDRASQAAGVAMNAAETRGSDTDPEYVEAVFFQLPQGKVRYLTTHMQKNLDDMKANMTDPPNFHLLPIMESNKSGINILGNKDDRPMGLGKLTLMCTDLRIIEKHIINKAFTLFLLSQNGLEQLQRLEMYSKITIEVNERNLTELDVAEDTYIDTADSFESPDGITITLHKGSIADNKFASEVIVNSVSKYGDLSLGNVSKNLMEAGGKKIHQEFTRKFSNAKDFLETTGGQLSCKKIYHTVCPNWESGSEDCEQSLADLVDKCLTKANKDKHKSISFPAIGTGHMRYPPEVVARVMMRRIASFTADPKQKYLKNVNIILYPLNRDVIANFSSQLKSLNEARCPEFRAAFPYNLKTKEGPRLRITKGSIIDEEVDVIVNTTSRSLDLSFGAVSKELLKRAGRTIQAECKQRKPKGIEYGEIVATTGGKMSCQLIYHGSCPKWNDAKFGCTNVLKQLLTNVLQAAHRDDLTSLALPAIGTGSLRYPVDIVIKTILEEVLHFSENNPWTSLKDIRLVIYDSNTLKMTKDYLEKYLETVWPKEDTTQKSEPEPVYDTVANLPGAVLMKMYGKDESVLHKSFDDICTLYRDNTTTTILDELGVQQKIACLDQTKRNIIRGMQKALGVHIEINKKKGQESIKLEGYTTNVENAVKAVNELLENTARYRDTLLANIPQNWDSMKPGEQVQLVELDKASPEFKGVQMGLDSTGGPAIVFQIERIQNPTLHLQYQAQKIAMERQGHNEQMLYHGTNEGAVRSINTYGFNRNFCGQNGTSYGQGVYFAKMAKYSCKKQYSPASKGLRYIYQCKVLVGRYTKGTKDMKHPPKIDPESDDFATYNSTVDDMDNPTIFAIFHDSQAYPEYLITFEK